MILFSGFEKYIRQTGDGVEMFITVVSNASKSALETAEDRIKLRICAPAVDGKANKAIILFLSDFFDVPKTKIKITKGEKSKHKTVLFLVKN